MKKGNQYEGIIDKIEFPNKGIMIIEEESGKTERLMIKNALPGQRVRAVVTKRRKGKSEGRILEILEKSPAEMDGGYCAHSVSYTHLDVYKRQGCNCRRHLRYFGPSGQHFKNNIRYFN